jgi:hypothetical protein
VTWPNAAGLFYMSDGKNETRREEGPVIPVDVKLEQIGRIVAWASRRLRTNPAVPRSSPSTKASMNRTGLSGPT